MLDPKTVGKNPVFSAEASQVFNNAIMTLGDEDRELPQARGRDVAKGSKTTLNFRCTGES